MKRIVMTLLVAGLLAAPMLLLSPTASAGVHVGIGVSVGVPPPALPVYAQPVIPSPGYIWTPGYWAWDPVYGDYYWVPGAWVMPPQVGLLWTPGWWGWSAGYYRWHPGYWGRHVGFYGGINYGFGYFGTGYVGGYWRGGHFYYNRAVNNINVTRVHNVYVDRAAIHNVHGNRVSYHGGRGGVMAHQGGQQRAWSNQRRYASTPGQTQWHGSARHSGNDRGRSTGFTTRPSGRYEGSYAAQAPSNGYGRSTAPSYRERGFMQAPRSGDRSFRAERTARTGQRGHARGRAHQGHQGNRHHGDHGNGHSH